MSLLVRPPSVAPPCIPPTHHPLPTSWSPGYGLLVKAWTQRLTALLIDVKQRILKYLSLDLDEGQVFSFQAPGGAALCGNHRPGMASCLTSDCGA